MTVGILYQQARCLVGYDDDGVAVAAVTVWSAGPGRPGLLEPMGVHRDTVDAGTARRSRSRLLLPSVRWVHRAHRRYPDLNKGAVATYAAAGFDVAPDVTDFRRPA